MKNRPCLTVFLLSMALAMALFSCAGAETNKGPMSALYDESREIGSDSGDFSRMIIYTAYLYLNVDDPEKSQALALGEIKAYNGYILHEQSGSFTVRIPVENMDVFLAKMKTLGIVDSENKSGTDITEKYRDDVVRLETLKEVRGRYQALLERAKTVEDILKIEKELERVNTEIEILERRKQAAEITVRYATISVYFDKKPQPGPFGWIFYGLYRGVRWLFVWD